MKRFFNYKTNLLLRTNISIQPICICSPKWINGTSVIDPETFISSNQINFDIKVVQNLRLAPGAASTIGVEDLKVSDVSCPIKDPKIRDFLIEEPLSLHEICLEKFEDQTDVQDFSIGKSSIKLNFDEFSNEKSIPKGVGTGSLDESSENRSLVKEDSLTNCGNSPEGTFIKPNISHGQDSLTNLEDSFKDSFTAKQNKLAEDLEEDNFENPPTNCCMSGCTNCVWLEYADRLRSRYEKQGLQKAIDSIEKEVEDPNLKAFLLFEIQYMKK